jgi:hypothetical protein
MKKVFSGGDWYQYAATGTSGYDMGEIHQAEGHFSLLQSFLPSNGGGINQRFR